MAYTDSSCEPPNVFHDGACWPDPNLLNGDGAPPDILQTPFARSYTPAPPSPDPRILFPAPARPVVISQSLSDGASKAAAFAAFSHPSQQFVTGPMPTPVGLLGPASSPAAAVGVTAPEAGTAAVAEAKRWLVAGVVVAGVVGFLVWKKKTKKKRR